MRGETRTGRVRYRENWRRKLILQVEVKGVATFRRYRDDIGYADIVTRWRDARLSDIYTGAFYGNTPTIIVRGQAGPQKLHGVLFR